ncbi:hypothetical protein F2Q69_00058927 [Brassica cretica]|uniref:Uncharacterized protein n=1 Tax=Brassica cretica TaxID=69181 RepID=A0A8S9RBN1_BRACR|nr:hypothetical protein F2Q69_00058927 [Brassica cretica]
MFQSSKKKHDDDHHTLRGDLETSTKARIDRHQPDEIDRQPPHIIDQRPPCLAPAVHKHQRLPICAEGAVGFHKRVKRIHDPVKIVVPCAVFEVEFPIPPDKGVHLSSYIESGGKKRRNWKKRKRTKGGSQLPLIPHSSDGVRKSRVCSKCFSQPLEKLRALLISNMIDKGEESKEEQKHCSRGTVAAIDTVAETSIDTVERKSIDTVAESTNDIVAVSL